MQSIQHWSNKQSKNSKRERDTNVEDVASKKKMHTKVSFVKSWFFKTVFLQKFPFINCYSDFLFSTWDKLSVLIGKNVCWAEYVTCYFIVSPAGTGSTKFNNLLIFFT